jgi:hypothetical protein
MPAVVTFDGPSREIREINTGLPSNELNLVEVYSEWKEWVVTSPQYAPAFRYAGADPISDIQNTGTTFFLLNGWRFVPADYNHQLIITGNLFTDPAGRSRTDFSGITAQGIEVVYTVSNLVDSSVARLDLAQLQQYVFIDTINGDDANTGTPTSPVQTEARAIAVATAENLRAFSIIGTLTLSQAYTDWKFIGTVGKESATVHINGQTLTRCAFEKATIDGNANGSTLFVEACLVETLTNALGVFKETGLNSVVSPGASGLLTFVKCYSDVPGTTRPVIDLADNLSDDCQIRGWHGGLEVRNVDVAGQNVSIDVDAGSVLIDSTCVDGTIVVRGLGTLIDNSGPGCTVVSEGFFDPDEIHLVRYGGAIHIDTAAGTAGTTYPIGTEENPSNNLADALTIANANGIRRFHVRGSVTLTGALPDWQVFGDGEEAEINLNGQDVADSEFFDLVVTGAVGTGPVSLTRCALDGVSGLRGTAESCSLRAGATTCAGNTSFVRCVSGVPGTGYPTIDMNGLAIGVEVRNYAGSFGLANLANAGATFSADMLAGRVIVEASCTAMQSGRLAGTAHLVDNGSIATWNLDGLVSFDTIWRLKDIPPAGLL